MMSKHMTLMLQESKIPLESWEQTLKTKARCQMNEYLKVANWKTQVSATQDEHANTEKLLKLLDYLHKNSPDSANDTG